MPRRSTGEYPENWKDIAYDVKCLAHWHCVRCGHRHDPSMGFTLTVHHMDLNKSNNAWWNTIALCQRCHLEIQSRVVLERMYMFEHSAWARPYIAAYYASIHGHPDDRRFVLANLESLLDYGRPAGGQKRFGELPISLPVTD